MQSTLYNLYFFLNPCILSLILVQVKSLEVNESLLIFLTYTILRTIYRACGPVYVILNYFLY